MTETTKLIAKMWKDASEKEKKPYAESYKKDKATFDRLLHAYQMSRSYKEHQEKMAAWRIHCTKKPFKKDPNAPKKPLTAWFIYAQDERPKVVEEFPEFKGKVTEVMKEVSNRWKKLSAEEQKPWVDQNTKAKEEYTKALAAYEKSEEYKAYTQEKSAYLEKMKAERRRLIKEAKKKHAG